MVRPLWPVSTFRGARAWEVSDDVQQRANYAGTATAVASAGGESRLAVESARQAIDGATSGGFSVAHEVVRIAFPLALEAAIDIGDLEQAGQLAELLATRPAGEVPPFLRAQWPAPGRLSPARELRTRG